MVAPTGSKDENPKRGYKIKIPKDWYTKNGLVLQNLFKLSKMVLSILTSEVVATFVADQFGIDQATEDIKNLKNMLNECENKVTHEGDVRSDFTHVTGAMYRSLKEFIGEVDKTCLHIGLERVPSEDSTVQWVLEKDMEKYKKEGESCLHEKVKVILGINESNPLPFQSNSK